jgi:hypothetical protein
MVDIGQSELFIRFDAPDGVQFLGESVGVPDAIHVSRAAREGQSKDVHLLQSTHLWLA